jgi:hypothetical protein
MVRKLAYIFTFLIMVSFIAGERKPDYVITTESSAIVTDNLSNVYTISKDKFTKYDVKLKFQKEFSNKTFGNITTADVTNPLRPLLFYRDFGRIVFLDNTLSQNGEPIALEKLGYPLATLAASSFDNGLWIYDQPSFELIRFDNALEISNRTGNLSQILGIELQPNFILEKDNHLFVNNPATGILIFDVYGTYIKTVPVVHLASFQVSDDNIIYFSEDILNSWNYKTAELSFYDEPRSESCISMRIERDAIFVQDSMTISSYIRKK